MLPGIVQTEQPAEHVVKFENQGGTPASRIMRAGGAPFPHESECQYRQISRANLGGGGHPQTDLEGELPDGGVRGYARDSGSSLTTLGNNERKVLENKTSQLGLANRSKGRSET